MYTHQQKTSQANLRTSIPKDTLSMHKDIDLGVPTSPLTLYLGGEESEQFGKRTEANKVNSLFLIDSYIKIYSIADMVKYSLLFLVLLVTTTYAQIGEDGTGTVNGYYIGPNADLTGANLRFAILTDANLYSPDPIGTDFTGANLSGAKLTDADLTGADLRFADLTDANLTGADLGGAGLGGADLSSANLTGAGLSGALLTNANLTGANLTGANLTGAKLTDADLTDADLTGVISVNITGTPTLPSGYQMVSGYIVGPNAILSGADLTDANLVGADLTGADLSNANLSDTSLTGADLTGANFSGADLTGAGLTGSNLTNADLSGADLSGAILYYATLTGADLSGANLSGANLDGANLSGAIWTNVISQSDYNAVVAQRDARPTQAAYDTVVAERDAKLTLDEVKDLRAGSTIIAVENGTATLSLEVEQSPDLEIWTSGGTTNLQIPVDADSETKFYRFKLDD